MLVILYLPVTVLGNCGTPADLQVSVAGNQVTFSWSGTADADVHAIMLWDKNTQQNSKAFTSVEASFSTSAILNGNYRWRVVALCDTRNSLTDHSEWIWGSDFDFSGNCLPPSVANAGADQLNIAGTNTVLSATAPSRGTGIWTIISGSGGSFSDVSSPSSAFTGTANTSYELRWTVSNECGSNYDDVTVSFCVPVSLSDAGADQAISSGTSTTLSAAQPSVGTGVWSVVSGTGGNLGDPSSATSSFTGTANTTYELCWTVSSVCNSSTDTVMISFCTPPVSTDFMGTGCLPTGDYALSAQLADGETGTWSVIEGEGGYFSDIHDPESSFRGLPNIDYKLRWTVSNACGSAYKERYNGYIKRKYNNPNLNPDLEYGSVTDIDCNEYPTIQIGNQTWMAENLRVKRVNEGGILLMGSGIPYSRTLLTYPQVTLPGGTFHFNPPGSSTLIDTADGIYYSYGAAINTRLCPKGWRVPDIKDGEQLADYLGGASIAGEKMKAVGRWNGSATNESGFSAVPSGYGRGGNNPINFIAYGSQVRFMTNQYISVGYYQYAPVALTLNQGNNSLAVRVPFGDFSDLGPCRCIKDDCTKTLVADAGSDKWNIRGTQIQIDAGNLPLYGNGKWSIVSGAGGNITEAVHYHQGTRITFDGATNTEYILRWSVSNACGDSVHDDINVSFCPQWPSAGADQSEIAGTVATLAAAVPQDGTGTWTIVSGADGSFGDASQPNSTFTGAMGATYVLRWTVTDKCGSASDDVTIHFTNPYLNPDLTYGSVTDIDGNQYPTIKIGAQTWMAGNLRTTRYNDGTVIPHVTDNAAWQGLATGAWTYYNHDENHNSTYGKLYNWHAAITGKLCPQGWHIPTRAEFNHLADYLGTSAGGKMKSIIGWNSPNTGATNESGFSGLPGGTRAADGSFAEIGKIGYWWTTTDLDGSNSWLRTLNHNNNGFNNNGLHRKRGLSCRCVKDCPPLVPNAGSDQFISGTNATILTAVLPSDETGTWSIISGTGGSFSNPSQPNSTFTGTIGKTYVLRWTLSNTCGSSLSDDVTVGFCSLADAGSDQIDVPGTSTTLEANVPSTGTGTWSIISGTGGSFGNPSQPNSTFTGIPDSTYILRWTVCDNFDDVTVSFILTYLNPDLTYGTVTDIDGNEYATIQIGNQTWMAENLKTTRYNDGTSIPNVTGLSWVNLTTGAWVNYNNDAAIGDLYGKLYNWHAVNTGKLCPNGWHIPTYAEWAELSTNVGGETGVRMKTTSGWDGSGHGGNGDNSSGFSGMPGGARFNDGLFYNIGDLGYWWSSTEDNTYYTAYDAWYWYLFYSYSYLTTFSTEKRSGLSCRCVKD